MPNGCDQEMCPYWTGDGCACDVMGITCDKVVFVQGHRHSEPVCAWPDCHTYLTPEALAQMDAAP